MASRAAAERGSSRLLSSQSFSRYPGSVSPAPGWFPIAAVLSTRGNDAVERRMNSSRYLVVRTGARSDQFEDEIGLAACGAFGHGRSRIQLGRCLDEDIRSIWRPRAVPSRYWTLDELGSFDLHLSCLSLVRLTKHSSWR